LVCILKYNNHYLLPFERDYSISAPIEDRIPKILTRVRTGRRRLEAYLAKLSQEDMLIPGIVGQWSIKDVIAHIMENVLQYKYT